MRFGQTLKKSVYPPWKDHYIDYSKLKKLLREHETKDGSQDGSDDEDSQWTEQDEENFVQELVNVQLDRINAFQVNTYKALRDRTSECEAKLEPLVAKEGGPQVEDANERREIAQGAMNDLDAITKEVSELEKFSRINFTGFLKAAKKHDRRRGTRYKVRPLLQVRLSQLPFNSEDYSPLLYRLSTMYSFIRQNLGQRPSEQLPEGPSVDAHLGQDAYTSHKFWVHMDNVLEVKTYILRRLPVLVYNPSVSSKDLRMTQKDPTITSLYFDGPKFELYNQKVAKSSGASSLRLRWTGQLRDQPEIYLEKKDMRDGDSSKEVRVRIKEKHIKSFLKGEYKMEKIVRKMQSRDINVSDPEDAEKLKRDVQEIQSFIREKKLDPVLRATYTRTAFQIPGDDRVRISLDTDLALIREDSLDVERPCRNPDDWHRTDIDNREMEFPFSEIRPGEISRFPYALLEIKVRGNTLRRTNKEWLLDLMSSHLVKDAPRFSKFVHGVAELFEDYVNSFPFWLSELDTDIRRDPETAFQEEQERIAKQAEDEMAVGSFLGGNRQSPSTRPKIGSPIHRVVSVESTPAAESSQAAETRPLSSGSQPIPIPEPGRPSPSPSRSPGLLSFIPRTMSRYAAAHRQRSEPLPPGVRHPGTWIKDSGPVRVEAKVWLANQRTFIKWQHICVLLTTLSLGLYNAAGAENTVARSLAVVYTGFAVFAGAWGWWMYLTRSRWIRERSGRDFDNVAGPMVVCLGLAVALVLNFWFKYTATVWDHPGNGPSKDLPAVNATSQEAEGAWMLVNQAAAAAGIGGDV
ncbi:hypothetical protein AJ79_03466 [Helicocarpus griseus UAMH5409]|uniref:SPX domain-containing protein n=1 Tax=Helicocarpus griseus UAMH5409 TaxID=1447875 RepID=A0A2B7XZ71_9EURO|nr:hypothetical protein AJ79_03466 [Helicocarpus griseus UAMH5409]